MKIFELNHVAIHVKDVPASCDFYGRVLRLEPMTRPAFDFPGAWFRFGQIQELHIIGGRSEPVNSHNRGNHFALLVDDLEAWDAHLRQAGATNRARRQRPDGASQLFLQDPDGHVVELFTPPPGAGARPA